MASLCAWAAPKVHFNVPEATVAQALGFFHDQAGANFLFVYAAATDKTQWNQESIRTQRVVGDYEPAVALTKILEGTGCTVTVDPDGTYEVKVGRVQGSAQAEGPNGGKGESGDGPELPPEVVVTGSLIRGLESITAPLVVISKNEKNRAAYATVQDVLRTLPQMFGGNVSEDFSLNGNFARGVGVDLRGLGTGATLVLVNGRRQPVSGIAGDYVDVSTVPWSAVERIEVLTDGASAIYGSDAISGVVNIIMRQDLDGVAEAQTRYGATPSGADEALFAQAFGHTWDGGRWFISYQYQQRAALAAADRAYSANADKRPYGGSDLRTIFSNPGNIVDPVTHQPTFAIPDGQNGRNLQPGDLLPGVINRFNQMALADLLPNKKTNSLYLTGSRRLSDRFEVFGESRFHHRRSDATEYPYSLLLTVPSTNPFFVSPVNGASFTLVDYNFINDLGPVTDAGTISTYTGVLGVKTNLGRGWQSSLSGYYGTEYMDWQIYNQADPQLVAEKLADTSMLTAFNPFGAGLYNNPATLDAIRTVQIERSSSSVKVVDLAADGPLPALPVGTPKMALGVNWRKEGLALHEVIAGHRSEPGPYERTVAAAFAELSLPLGAKATLSLAGREEHYSDFGDTFNPKIGLRWALTDSWRVRGSWGTSFRAPTLVNVYDKSQDVVALFPLADPHAPSGYSLVLYQQLSNPNLHQETARSLTMGLDFSPSWAAGLTISTTYYNIDYGNRIFQFPPNLPLTAVLADDIWSPLVTRNPSRSQVESLCASRTYSGSSADCLASSPDAIVDLRLRNLSRTTVSGLDGDVRQQIRSEHGQWDIGLKGSFMLNYDQVVTSSAPGIDLVGFALHPPRVRVRGTVDWSQFSPNLPGWGFGIATDYLSAGRYATDSGMSQVHSLATMDVQLNYRTAPDHSWFGNLDFTLNAVNVFNRAPPFVDIQLGYDPGNTKPYGRVVSIAAQKSW